MCFLLFCYFIFFFNYVDGERMPEEKKEKRKEDLRPSTENIILDWTFQELPPRPAALRPRTPISHVIFLPQALSHCLFQSRVKSTAIGLFNFDRTERESQTGYLTYIGMGIFA
jgi:hypothetical protein